MSGQLDNSWRQPQTRGEWQDVVDAAYGALALESARLYGLVAGGPVVNVDRCEHYLKLGKARGFTPAQDAAEQYIQALMHERGKRGK